MRRLRVAHCLESVAGGGVEQRRLTLARRLDPDRYEQILICTQAVGAVPDDLRRAGCPVHEIGIFRGLLDWTRYGNALRVLNTFRPDIVHGAVYEGVAVAAISGRLARAAVIVGEETVDPVTRRVRGHLAYRLLCAATHHMVAISPAVERYLVQDIRIPRAKVSLIVNGVVEAEPAPPEALVALRARCGLKPGEPVVGTVGRLHDGHKKVSDLIRALPAVQRQYPAVKLLVVGDGPDRPALERLAAELGMSDAVVFAGYQGDARPFFEVMDVFALASTFEGLPLALVEAMFAGLAAVATPVGGVPYVVVEGLTALLVEPGNPPAIAARLLDLLGDPARRRAMGEAGRRRARELFSADRYVAEVDDLYQRLARERGLL